ncbi:MAG: hydrolase, partial [Propionibacteriaceae bacterium]|nr:hydrolase [Propionibacteriaceae bacterium]
MSLRIDDVATELGPARMFGAVPTDPAWVLLLGHGAGGGVDAPDLKALTRLSDDAVAVLRFEQPWRTAGKRVAPAPARLDLGWLAARAYAQERFPALPLRLGGRSAGARVACRSAAGDPAGVAGVIALSFPLHPPGKPAASRATE